MDGTGPRVVDDTRKRPCSPSQVLPRSAPSLPACKAASPERRHGRPTARQCRRFTPRRLDQHSVSRLLCPPSAGDQPECRASFVLPRSAAPPRSSARPAAMRSPSLSLPVFGSVPLAGRTLEVVVDDGIKVVVVDSEVEDVGTSVVVVDSVFVGFPVAWVS